MFALKPWVGLACAIFVFTTGTVNSQDKPRLASASEQSKFTVNGRVQEAVTMPNDVLLDLKEDKVVKAVLAQGSPADASSLLSASVIHLSSTDEQDLVIVGQKELAGDGMTLFWIYRPSPSGHDMVLTTYGSELTVKNSRTKGFRDITVTTPNGSHLHRAEYRFDGHLYLIANETF